MNASGIRAAAIGVLLFAWPALLAAQWDVRGDVSVEARYFWEDPQFFGQSDGLEGSLAFNLEARWRNEAGNQRVSILPFGRLDGVDNERSHFDLREAYWAFEGSSWEVLLGANKVFWGVAESRHLVDVINQTDLVEDPDREQKLGQPMISALLERDWGQLEFFVMPWFRERTYPGEDGRLRPPLVVDTDRPLYESSAGQHHTDLALRWSHYFGDVDVGVHYFNGTSREPQLLLSPAFDSLQPRYFQMEQAGVDLQYTRNAWLWKLEAIARDGLDDSYFATVAGFEYTFYGVRDSATDTGLLIEYLYDGRGPSEPVSAFDDDLFVGTRFTFNDVQDTNILAGIIHDLHASEWFFNLEAERRLGEHFVAQLRLRMFHGDRQLNQLQAFDHDDYVQFSLFRYF